MNVTPRAELERFGWRAHSELALALHDVSLQRMHLHGKLHPDDGSCQCNEWAKAVTDNANRRPPDEWLPR